MSEPTEVPVRGVSASHFLEPGCPWRADHHGSLVSRARHFLNGQGHLLPVTYKMLWLCRAVPAVDA